ncbi:MAG: hypothetical protein ACI9TO_000435 [Rickettsiales bacterium]|jgi:hypothetical protein
MPNLNILLICIILSALLSGCVSHTKKLQPISIATGVNFELIDLHILNKSTILSQNFQGSYSGRKYSINLITQISPTKMTMVGLSAIGSRLFTIQYDNRKIDFNLSKMIPANKKIKVEYVLADMQLVYFPIQEIRRNLTGNVTINETANKRVFYKNNKPFIEIKYSSSNVWNSKIDFHNLEREYQYSIENLAQ